MSPRLRVSASPCLRVSRVSASLRWALRLERVLHHKTYLLHCIDIVEWIHRRGNDVCKETGLDSPRLLHATIAPRLSSTPAGSPQRNSASTNVSICEIVQVPRVSSGSPKIKSLPKAELPRSCRRVSISQRCGRGNAAKFRRHLISQPGFLGKVCAYQYYIILLLDRQNFI